MFGLRTRRSANFLTDSMSHDSTNPLINLHPALIQLSAFADFQADWLAQVFVEPGGELWHVTAAQLLPIFTAFPNS